MNLRRSDFTESVLQRSSDAVISRIDFRKDLNPEQLQAVETLEGPVLVIAGAGSGKTRTLVYRVARLVASGVDPGAILLLTFTRKAASAMLTRAAELVGSSCRRVAGGTFHGFAHGMLRRYGHLVGYPNTFTILDRSDIRDLLHLLARQMELVGPGSRFPKKATLAAIISKVENRQTGMAPVIERYFPHLVSELAGLEKLLSAYRAYKRAHALMDYDDLLLRWRDVLAEHEPVRASVGRRFRYIMVDEYQDTNAVQAEIVRLTAFGHDNVMVVGDDAQSIYSFRGANFKNILDFPRQFPNTRIIKLERNYRSTQPNLDCTNAIIANAREMFTKRLVAQRQGGHCPRLYTARDEVDQARFVADRIREFMHHGVDPSEIAVLFRAAFHSFQLETELNSRCMEFIKLGGLRLLESAHIKDLLALLRLLINPLDRLSWNRVLLLIQRLGPKGVERIFAELSASDDPLAGLSVFETKAAWKSDVRQLGVLLKGVRNAPVDLPEALLRLEAWYRPHLERIYPGDYPRRLQELAHLRAMASRYEDAVTLLGDLSLDPPDREETDGAGKRLVLSTMHSAKGLEWKVVFILSMAEGRFPSPAASTRNDEIEEERRLFYVAATRAKDFLFFCYPSFISVSGSGLLPARPSRFLEEIPAKLVASRAEDAVDSKEGRDEIPQNRSADNVLLSAVGGKPPAASRVEKTRAGGISANSRSCPSTRCLSAAFQAGARVRHPIFGAGQVIKAMGPEKIQVLFDVAGLKTLHLDFAKLSILN